MPVSIASVVANESPWHVEINDALRGARLLPDNCLSMIATSPPYYGLRDYQTGKWEGGDPACDHKDSKQVASNLLASNGPKSQRNGRTASETKLRDGLKGVRHVCKCGATRIDEQIGLEDSPEEYAAKLVALFRELRRALHPTGTLWLNLGDSYSNDTKWGGKTGGKHAAGLHGQTGVGRGKKNTGLKQKDLIGVPWLVAFALRADGWYLRQWMPWVKSNAMPESADDRPSTSCETVFILAKSSDYFFDMEAVKRPSITNDDRKPYGSDGAWQMDGRDKWETGAGQSQDRDPSVRNFRSADLWFDSRGMLLAAEVDGTDDNTVLGFDVTLKSYRGAHFAVWPPDLVRPMIQAGSSEHGVCPHCFAPHTRIVKKVRVPTRPGDDTKVTGDALTDGNRDPERHVTRTETLGWKPSCDCPEHESVPAIVYDPFTGSGTTGKVALELNRRFLGSELNPDYFALIEKRMKAAKASLF
jgi:DNA modification methylase